MLVCPPDNLKATYALRLVNACLRRAYDITFLPRGKVLVPCRVSFEFRQASMNISDTPENFIGTVFARHAMTKSARPPLIHSPIWICQSMKRLKLRSPPTIDVKKHAQDRAPICENIPVATCARQSGFAHSHRSLRAIWTITTTNTQLSTIKTRRFASGAWK